MDFPSREQFEKQIQKELPAKPQTIPFRVDMAPLDPRQDPKDTRGIPLYVYDPATQAVSTEPLMATTDTPMARPAAGGAGDRSTRGAARTP